MKLTEEIKNKIIEEFNSFKEKQYAGKTEKERKVLNQFFTPPELTIKMLEKFDDLDGSIVDPCCGAGNLIIAAAIVKNNPNEVFGCDLDPKMVELSTKRFENYFNVSFKNIKLNDSTKELEKFDKAITNPPFNKNGANLIELDIINQIVKNTKSSVVLCTMTNITDLCGPLKQGNKYKKYKDVLNGKLKDLEIIKNSDSYFNIDLAKDLGILTLVETTNKNYDDFRLGKYNFVFDIYSKVVNEKMGINKQWKDNSTAFSVPLKVLVSANNYNLIAFEDKIRNTNVNFKPTTSVKKSNAKVAKVLNFNSQEEVENFKKSVLTDFIYFLVKHSLTSQNIKNVNKFIPYMKDYSKVWTDEMYFDFFNLTEEQRKLIKDEMRNYRK